MRETEFVDVTLQVSNLIGGGIKRAIVIRPSGGVGGGSEEVIDLDGSVTFDSGELIIEFTNGKRLRCWNSEWGGIDDGSGAAS